ncbi:MAG TPA: O-acetyl-ADP-ribose deacetylase [Spirochaetota bacterium]|nr:O-acetyl-ADP-ribose deacetylase [Spirochaetota bacterium]HPS86806.1 O-acetyl-ADP-ribose deacetylase [Spirochaetota bacterium]
MDTNEIIKHISIKKGDITREMSDAIVNAANTSLLGGGGVDGAIHKAAGPELLEECRKFGGCRTGEARITSGYNLHAKFVIHTPGPVYKDGKHKESEELRNSYRNSMLLVKENNLKSVSFPAISTGVYRYPKNEAAEIAVSTVINFMRLEKYIVDVSFVLFDNDNYEIYKTTLEGLKK